MKACPVTQRTRSTYPVLPGSKLHEGRKTSNGTAYSIYAGVAQLVEQLICKRLLADYGTENRTPTCRRPDCFGVNCPVNRLGMVPIGGAAT